MSTLQLVTPPPVEPLTLAQAKAHLRVTDSADDDFITDLITIAREQVEHDTKRALIRQTWDWYLDAFPAWFRVPLPPLQGIAYIQYLDTSETLQILDPAVYRVDLNPDQGRINLEYARVWPWSFPVTRAVTVRFVAGYPSDGGSPEDLLANVPRRLVQAMRLLIGSLYENREAVVASRTRGGLETVPMGYFSLISPYIASLA
jgi:uncharacterized phiE125 gp8 family phage protein